MIQRAFLSWLDMNHERFDVKIRLGARTDAVQEFSFAGIVGAISGAVTPYEINVYVIHEGDCWDLLLSLDAYPKRTRGGFFCADCAPDARAFFPDRPALWADHLFEPLLQWVNESLATAKWLALFGNPNEVAYARLLAGDDASQQLPGGGITINPSVMVGCGEFHKNEKQPPILLPCRIG